MWRKQVYDNLGCNFEYTRPEINAFVDKAKGYYNRLFQLQENKACPHLECECAQKISQSLSSIPGVLQVDVEVKMGTVRMEGNFEEEKVMNWFKEEMGKKAIVVLRENNVFQMPFRLYEPKSRQRGNGLGLSGYSNFGGKESEEAENLEAEYLS